MTLAELIARYRLEAVDDTFPFFVEDKDVKMWINDAYRQAAIRGRLIRDDVSPAVCEIPYGVGSSVYRLNPAVFEIINMRMAPVASPTRPKFLTIKSREWMDNHCSDWRDDPSRWADYAIQDDTSIRLVGTYAAGDILKLECYRFPLKKLVADIDKPEFHEAHHEHLVYWVLYKAFGRQDADMYDPARAAEAETAFTDYFGPMPDSDMRRATRSDVVHHNTPYIL